MKFNRAIPAFVGAGCFALILAVPCAQAQTTPSDSGGATTGGAAQSSQAGSLVEAEMRV
jgi:hypothetical protein